MLTNRTAVVTASELGVTVPPDEAVVAAFLPKPSATGKLQLVPDASSGDDNPVWLRLLGLFWGPKRYTVQCRPTVLAKSATRLAPGSIGVKAESDELRVAWKQDCSPEPVSAVIMGEARLDARNLPDLAVSATQPLPEKPAALLEFSFATPAANGPTWIRSVPARVGADGLGWVSARSDHVGVVGLPWQFRAFESADELTGEATGHLIAWRCETPIQLTQLIFETDELDSVELFDDAQLGIMRWTKGAPSNRSVILTCGHGQLLAVRLSGLQEPLSAALALPADMAIKKAKVFLGEQPLGEATCANSGPSVLMPVEESGQCADDVPPALAAIAWRQDITPSPRWSSPWLCIPAGKTAVRVAVQAGAARDEIASLVNGRWQLQRPCTKGRFCKCMLGNVSVDPAQNCPGGCAPARRTYPGCETATECLHD